MTHYNYIDEDLLDRAQLREKYFEDKRYRKWSSVYPMRRVHYGARPERFFISDYLGITSYAIFEMNDLEFINIRTTKISTGRLCLIILMNAHQ